MMDKIAAYLANDANGVILIVAIVVIIIIGIMVLVPKLMDLKNKKQL